MKRRTSKSAGQSKVFVDSYLTELLSKIERGKTLLPFAEDTKVYSQGDAAKAIFFIQTGKVKLTVVSAAGKEAILAMLGPPAFLGEACLAGQTVRINTATAIEASTLFRVDKRTMAGALRAQPELSEKFTRSLLARNVDLEEDLCDQLFNHSEKRLARALLKLGHFGPRAAMPTVEIPSVSHETLAEMVGTTRSRITLFMNKFRRLGLIDYDHGKIVVRAEMLGEVILND
jgi:CRP/FNR family transcriptional regulator, cyclic AMP receptor protein